MLQYCDTSDSACADFSLPQLKYKGKNGSKETRMFTVPKEKVDVTKTGAISFPLSTLHSKMSNQNGH